MSLSNDADGAASLPELRAQLSALGYASPLGLESAPLAGALLRDLLAVADAFVLLRGRLLGAEAAAARGRDELEPLRREHSRLVRANAAVRASPLPAVSLFPFQS